MENYSHKPQVESHKSFFEYFKHITTLNTGAILLMIAFFERAFTNPEGILFAVLAFVLFIISLICSVLSMYNCVDLIWHEEEALPLKDNKFRKFVKVIVYFISKYGFILGMVLLAIFGIINIINGSGNYLIY